MQMKKLFGLALMAATLAPVAFVSCDDDETKTLVQVDRSGVYKQKNTIGAMGIDLGSVPAQNVTLAKETNGSYTVTLGSYDHKISSQGSPFVFVKSEPMIIRNVKASTDGSGVTKLSHDAIKTTVVMQMQAAGAPLSAPKTYAVNVGTLTGAISKDGKLGLTVSFQPGSMPAPLIYVLTPAE